MKKRILNLAYFATLALLAAPYANAYIGPGGGLTAVGVLVALFAAAVVIFFGFLWYPIKRIRKARRERKLQSPAASVASVDKIAR